MARYIAKRLVSMVLVFFLLTFILFVLYQMMPANRAYTDARTEIQTMKRLSEEEKAVYIPLARRLVAIAREKNPGRNYEQMERVLNG